MKRTVLLGGSAAVLVAGAALAAPALTAAQTEDAVRQAVTQIERALTATGLVKVERRDYRRGLAESTDETTLLISPPGEDPLRVRVRSRVQHGPFPGFREVAQAVVTTELVFDPEVQREIDAALGGGKPQIRTVVGFGGNVSARVYVPAGKVEENPGAEGGSLVWDPLEAFVTVRGDRTETTLTWPSLRLRASEGADAEGAALEDLRYTARQRRVGEFLTDGDGVLSAKSFSFTADGARVAARNLRVTTTARADGANYESRVRYELGELAADGATARDLKLHLRARLDRAALEDVLRLVRDAGAGNDPAAAERLMGQVVEAAGKLLKGSPEFALERLSARGPDGEVVVTGKVGLVGAEGLDPDALMASSGTALLPFVRAEATLAARERALAALLDAAGEDGAEAVAGFVEQGLLVREGGGVRARLAFDGQDATLNGRPLPSGGLPRQ